MKPPVKERPRLLDLISLGEPLLRLAPPACGRLEQAQSLEVRLAGAQMNVAANLACLGKRTAFITKVPDNPLGTLAIDSCRGCGVDVRYMRRQPHSRMGLVFVEFSVAPRVPVSVYDRARSAASTIGPTDFDWPGILAGGKLAYSDGIFLGLSESTLAAGQAFFKTARQLGCTTCFDVNYREHLWTKSAAHNVMKTILPLIDVLVINRDVAEKMFGYRGSDEELMRRFAGDFGCGLVCCTRREIIDLQHGAWQSAALSEGVCRKSRRHAFDIIDRYGTGDAWFAGLLWALLENKELEYALNFAGAMCALAHTVEGDVAHLQVPEIQAIMDAPANLQIRR